mmetsp:Transcript_16408/g.32581  ORF Transcript_16408/g.32581 Transcript_16408/m.32581 type:complete len:139 (-) Transcript_16408:164-580(-)
MDIKRIADPLPPIKEFSIGQLNAMFQVIDDESDDEVEGVSCRTCGMTPCKWVQHRSEISRRVLAEYGDVLNWDEFKSNRDYVVLVHRACCKHAYRAMTFILQGTLGRGIRRKLPRCIEVGIHSVWECPDKNYMGFKHV